MAQKLVIRKAARQKAFLKLGMASPSGGGKTMGALIVSYGLMKEKYPNLSDAELWEKIVIVDSENGSGELYVNHDVPNSNLTIGEYAVLSLEAPFEPGRYTEAIKLAHNNDFEVCIIDSMTHMWTGTGGALEKQGKIAARKGNSWTAWRDVTPEITTLIDTMLQTPIHIISTMRSKTDHVQEKNANGKTVIRKVGLNPIIRDGMEYEFTTFFEIGVDHEAFCSKDRTGIFDGKYFTITEKTGMDAMKWLESGSDGVGDVIAKSPKTQEEKDAEKKDALKKFMPVYTKLGKKENKDLLSLIEKYTSDGNPNNISTAEEVESLIKEAKELLSKGEK